MKTLRVRKELTMSLHFPSLQAQSPLHQYQGPHSAQEAAVWPPQLTSVAPPPVTSAQVARKPLLTTLKSVWNSTVILLPRLVTLLGSTVPQLFSSTELSVSRT